MSFPTLDDFSITYNQSSAWQKIADIPDDVFEDVIANIKEESWLNHFSFWKKALEYQQDRPRKEPSAIIGRFDVLVIDPPWPETKIERATVPEQAAFDYPTMSLEEIAALDVPALCGDDCHVWLWTTHKYLPDALNLLNTWGLRYVCTFVWHKPGGFQPFNLPQYNCEFALYARQGSPEFADLKDLPTCFAAPRGKHSEKPEAFYDLVRRVTAGRRMDMFNRRYIEGFESWGNEAHEQL